ncbi:iron ABC transporter permease [Leucobacter rhizosphaerae]|uniref:Iron ABC transporter permease n=1 Tax=Leucobacter rhizosphaerae TaxID=2932245 RepID=A0ABY4FZV7_9MICO|nr:iron ABC transporter permease [Leucobacter rhizosphaerae]UOQ61843.1 iron ABC transporter permease [Leucobacter rhizosphaerae]
MWIAAGCAVILLLVVASVVLGVRAVSITDIGGALQGASDSINEAAVAKRLPRTVLALLVGAALGVSGAVMQAVTRNPLAEPGLLGVSSGAALAVVVGISFFGLTRPLSLMTVAIAGAAAAAVFVYAVGSLGRGGATPLRLALAGAASSAAFVSLMSAVMLPRVDLLRTFQFWRIGGVGGATWESILTVLPLLVVGMIVALATTRSLNSLALGDDLAAGLGVHVGRARLIAAVGAVILCGAATAVAGPIAFVGLVVPHLCRMLFGPDHRWLLPSSAIAGAALLLASDVVGRIVARPEEIEVGIVTALVGAPFFIWIVRRQKVREL